MNLACMGTSLITIINIKNDLQLDRAEANKQIANKKINDPKCKKDCKTEAKKELEEAESLYVKTKEGYIVGLTPKEVDKLNPKEESIEKIVKENGVTLSHSTWAWENRID